MPIWYMMKTKSLLIKVNKTHPDSNKLRSIEINTHIRIITLFVSKTTNSKEQENHNSYPI